MTDWIEWKWTPEKPYPDVKGEVFIKIKGHSSFFPANVREWAWETSEGITHYRIASEEN